MASEDTPLRKDRAVIDGEVQGLGFRICFGFKVATWFAPPPAL